MKALETSPRVRWSVIPAILLALFGSIATARAQLNLVYLESNIGVGSACNPNTDDSNSIYAFSNSGGVLTQLSGSPYLTGGAGVCDPGNAHTAFDADQEVVIVNDSYLLAVNGDSNTISSFTINPDGSLTAVGSPVASGGQDPVSIGVDYNVLTIGGSKYSWVGVVNKNEDPNQNISGAVPNFTTFTLSSTGELSPIAGSTVNLAAGSSPSQMLVLPKLHYAYLDVFMGSTAAINAYKITSTGVTSAIDSAPPPVSGYVLLGLAVNPNARYIYAGLPESSPNPNEVGVYTYEASTGTMPGAVSLVGERKNEGKAVCWFAVNSSSAGTFLYSAESSSGTVSVYNLAHPAAPALLQHFTVTTPPGGKMPEPANLAFDPTGTYLYCLDNVNSVLHVLAVDSMTGEVSEPNEPIVLPSPAKEGALGLATLCIPTGSCS
jgi:6-phosphogluconolactonase (cycloisomerase 2 family)